MLDLASPLDGFGSPFGARRGGATPLTIFGSRLMFWCDLSDVSSLYQSTDTSTPVAALDDPIGRVSDKSGKGNHATQGTSASRPLWSARVNLLTYSEQFDNAAWTKSSVTVTANAAVAPDGTTTADLIYPTTSGTDRFIYQARAYVIAGLTIVVHAKMAGKRWIRLASSATSPEGAYFDLQNGVVGTIGALASNASITALGNGWYRCQVSVSSGSYLEVFTTDADGSTSVTTNGTDGVYLWGGDYRSSNVGVGLPVYQSIAAASSYDTVGFPFYASFDGVDDSWATAAIDFSASDKVAVFAAVTKQTSPSKMIVELSASALSNAGSFTLTAGTDAGVISASADGYSSLSRGTAAVVRAQGAQILVAAPDLAVLSVTHDIAGSLSTIRRNGIAGTDATASKGTGNFGNYPVYIGQRGGTSLPLRGAIYQLFIVQGAVTAAEIAAAEAYLNSKSSAF